MASNILCLIYAQCADEYDLILECETALRPRVVRKAVYFTGIGASHWQGACGLTLTYLLYSTAKSLSITTALYRFASLLARRRQQEYEQSELVAVTDF